MAERIAEQSHATRRETRRRVRDKMGGSVKSKK